MRKFAQKKDITTEATEITEKGLRQEPGGNKRGTVISSPRGKIFFSVTSVPSVVKAFA
jgi:hypothetical protein